MLKNSMSTNCVISFEDTETKVVQTITGKNAIVSEVNINSNINNFKSCYSNSTNGLVKVPIMPTPVTISFTLEILDENFMREIFSGTTKPKLRNKKVDDCTIQELLYAVRQKINNKR